MSTSSIKAPDFLQQHLERFAKENNFKNAKFQISNASKDGDNYLGSLYRVKMEGEENCANTEINFIIKCIPQDEELRIVLRATSIYLNEIAFYEERFPIFMKLLKEYNIESNDVPGYHGGCKSPGKEVIILLILLKLQFLTIWENWT